MARPNPTIVKYIEKHIAKGFDVKKIKRRLAEAGHPIEAIEDAATFVLGTAPPTKRRIPRFMIVYGIILMLVISAGVWFFWFKATQVKEYVAEKEVVEQKLETDAKFDAMSDIELLKYAASTEDLSACEFVEGHNEYYACTDRYWERDDCSYERLFGMSLDECNLRKKFGSDRVDMYCQAFQLNCTLIMALGENDESFCENNPGCLEEFYLAQGTVEACMKLESILQTDCLKAIAVSTDNKSVCDLITRTGGDSDKELPDCKLHFMSDSEKGIVFSEYISGTISDGTSSRYDIMDSFDELFERDEDSAICSELSGEYGGISFSDYCLFIFVSSALFEGQEDEEMIFDSTQYEGICPKITSPKLKDCCQSMVNEKVFKPGCDFIS